MLWAQQPVVNVAHGEGIEDGIGGGEVPPANHHDAFCAGAQRPHADEELDRILIGRAVSGDHKRGLDIHPLEVLELVASVVRLGRRDDAVVRRVALAYLSGDEPEIVRITAHDDNGRRLTGRCPSIELHCYTPSASLRTAHPRHSRCESGDGSRWRPSVGTRMKKDFAAHLRGLVARHETIVAVGTAHELRTLGPDIGSGGMHVHRRHRGKAIVCEVGIAPETARRSPGQRSDPLGAREAYTTATSWS